MSKYAPLGEFLRNQSSAEICLSFREIETIIGTSLPNAKGYAAWWSNNPFNNVMTRVWLDAGFKTEKVDVNHGRLVFRRTDPDAPVQAAGRLTRVSRKGRHPALGALKGLIAVDPGTDLTEPADADWISSRL